MKATSRLFVWLAVVLPLLAGTSSYGLNLAIGDSYYLGSVVQGTPADEDHEAAYINQLASMAPGTTANDLEVIPGNPPDSNDFTRSNNVFGALPDAEFLDKNDAGTPLTFDLTGSTQYILSKYGQGSLVWFLAGYTGSVTVASSFNGHGLSHTSFFGGNVTVPDGGATLVLLGAALSVLGMLRRRF